MNSLSSGTMRPIWLSTVTFATSFPNMCLMPGEKDFADYPVGKSAEWYYAELKKNPP